MLWFWVTIAILIGSGVWGFIDWVIEVRKVRNKEYEERNG